MNNTELPKYFQRRFNMARHASFRWWVMRAGVLSLLFLFLFTIVPVHAQPMVIRPGSPILNTDRIEPEQAHFIIYKYDDGQLTRLGELRDHLQLGEDGATLQRIQHLQFDGQPLHTDSVMADVRSLLPQSHHSRNEFRSIDLDFRNRSAQGQFEASNGEIIAINHALLEPVFDSNWVDVVLRTLPLEAGYQAIAKTFEVSGQGRASLVDYHIKVSTERATVDFQGTSVNTWVVKQTKPGSFTTFYVHPDTRQILQIRTYSGPRHQMLIKRNGQAK
ncbi:MAG: hypothetical protein ACQETE_06575 [Bacteroidota bacterium]